MTKVKRTGGNMFDPSEKNVYFVASGVDRLKHVVDTNDHFLVALNEMNSEYEVSLVHSWMTDNHKKVFIDSGVYNLATTYAKTHNVSMDVALSTPPSNMAEFEPFFDRYIEVVSRIKDDCWGYIEIDQGGRENKIKTRERIESYGLTPIPVYHPLNDGWDYFDYLAQRYDRICLGNVVMANASVRKRLLATAWERHQKYPDLWIHVLGYTPNEYLNAYPLNSTDSSSWLRIVRWADSFRERAALKTTKNIPRNFRYDYDADTDSDKGSEKAITFSGYTSNINMHNWRNYMAEIEAIGGSLYDNDLG